MVLFLYIKKAKKTNNNQRLFLNKFITIQHNYETVFGITITVGRYAAIKLVG